jgi:hypothetical protein
MENDGKWKMEKGKWPEIGKCLPLVKPLITAH